MKFSSENRAKLFAPALLFAALLAIPAIASAANDGGFAVDGYLAGSRGGDCLVLREHDGSVRYVTGNLGSLQTGDHVRLYGFPVSGSACGVRGSAYEVSEVLTIWGDDRHRTTLFDHLTDGSFDRYISRQSGDDRYGRSTSSGSYDRYGNWRSGGTSVVSLLGTLNDSRRGCPGFLADNGRFYYLVGDLRGYRSGSTARIIGWPDADSQCGGPAIDVREIDR
jgi:hypothetical protein